MGLVRGVSPSVFAKLLVGVDTHKSLVTVLHVRRIQSSRSLIPSKRRVTTDTNSTRTVAHERLSTSSGPGVWRVTTPGGLYFWKTGHH